MASKCDFCLNYVFDEEYGMAVCQVDLDMDEMERYIGGSFDNCPYFTHNDEYKIVRKQN